MEIYIAWDYVSFLRRGSKSWTGKMGTTMIGINDASIQTDLGYFNMKWVPEMKEMQKINCKVSLTVTYGNWK